MDSLTDGLLISDTARRKFSAAVDKQNLIAQTGKFTDDFAVVECLTRDRGVAGSSLTCVTALWSLSKTQFFYPS